jgi:geranylgeranyl pyrophosphate synthase
MKGPIDPSEVGEAARLLAGEGAHDFARAKAEELTARALKDLEQARPQGAAREALFWLAYKLVSRSE